MFYRKITEQFENWLRKQETKKTGLVVQGLRQIGKTTAILDFLEKHYQHVNVINFKDSPEFKEIFKQADFKNGISNLFASIGALMPDADLTSEGAVLFLDEIQECGRARYGIKPLLANTNLHIVASGSLLGISGYNREIDGDIPSGSEDIITMYPMDFEEFLLASGEKESTLALLKDYFDRGAGLPQPIHEKMLTLFQQYMIVGGLPEVVDIFMKTRSFAEVRQKQKSLLLEYRGDFGRYVDKDGNVRIDNALQHKLNLILDSVPSQLAKEKNRFVFKDIPGSPRKDAYEDALDWLCGFGLCKKCCRLDKLSLPLSGWANPDIYKIYFQDSGLFLAMLDDSTTSHIIQGDFSIYKGAIYENIVADAFIKKGRKLYYYGNQNGLEIDFIIEKDGKPALVEVKARSGRTKASDTVLNDKEKYGVDLCIKLTASNIGIIGNKHTYPYYLTHLV